MNAKEIFKKAHREARSLRILPWRAESTAFDLSEVVARNLIEFDGLDYRKVLPVTDALLWTLHWKYMVPLHVCKLWQSERNYSWNTRGDGRVYLEPPRLP
jgi:hypothetical protein